MCAGRLAPSSVADAFTERECDRPACIAHGHLQDLASVAHGSSEEHHPDRTGAEGVVLSERQTAARRLDCSHHVHLRRQSNALRTTHGTCLLLD